MEDPEVRKRVGDLLEAAGAGLVGLVLVVIGGSTEADVVSALGVVVLLAAVAWAVAALFALAKRVKDHA